jgi:CBS domain-containing protein
MQVKDVMTTPVCSVGPCATIEEALGVLGAKGITSVPVVDDGRVVGIVSEADLLRGVLSPDPRAHQILAFRALREPPETVRSVMTAPPYVTRGDEDVSDLLRVMAEHGWKSIPVVHEGNLVGIVSRSDVVHALRRADSDIRDDVRHVFAEMGHAQWAVTVVAGVATVTGPATPGQWAAASAEALAITGVRRVVPAGPVPRGPVAAPSTARLWPLKGMRSAGRRGRGTFGP